MKSDANSVIDSANGKLREVSAKLRSVAYLIENHRDAIGEPLDIEDIYWGIGILLSELSWSIKHVAIQLDENQVRGDQRKKS
jgi:hypothetical protein